MVFGNAVGDVIFRMCVDYNDAVFFGICFWGFVFAVVVETGHAPSLPDGTGMEQGRNRDGTGTEQGRNRDGTGTEQEQGQGQGRGVAWCGG